MSRSLILTFNSAVAKYSRLNKKVRKSISQGEFWRLTHHKRQHLLHKIERLKRRISELRLQLKIAGAGLAAGLLMMGTPDALAQKQGSALGPFVENFKDNPFKKPAFAKYSNPVVSFWDMDKDGDLDAAITSSDYAYTQYYLNSGTNKEPQFKSYWTSGIDTYRYSASTRGRIAFADIDDDGDLDAIVGMDTSDDDLTPDVQNDVIFYYRNDALSPTDPPNFVRVEGSENPFAQMFIKKEGWPAFSDIDKDGDLDFILAGEYDDTDTKKTAWVQVFRNQKEGHEAGIAPSYQPLQANNNPLYIGESPITASAGFFDISFADLDGDGDEDFFWTDQHGQTMYKRNDGGVFVDQSGDYVYKPDGQSTGNPMEIDGLSLSTPDSYKTLAFGDLDGDGDTDLVIGTNNIGTLNSPYIYVENTGNGVMVPNHGFDNPISGFTMGHNPTATFIDYDNDGDQDFLTTGTISVPQGSEGLVEDETSHAFFKNNNGNFELQTLLDDPFAALIVKGNAGRWLTADVDGDSDIDALFVYSQYDDVLHYNILALRYYKNNNGAFQTIEGIDSPLKPILDKRYYFPTLGFGDLNSDGLPDVIMTGENTTPIFFKNTGTIADPKFEQDDTWKTGLASATNGINPKVVDLDSDGDNDLVLGKYWFIWYYQNIGDSKNPQWKEYQEQYQSEGVVFNLENPFGALQTEGGGIMPDVVDVDGDGDKDLFFASQNRGTFFYYENQNPSPLVVIDTQKNFSLVPGQPINLAPQATVNDPDGDNIAKIVVKIEPFQAGLEKLQVQNEFGDLTISWADTTGILTIFGPGDYLTYQDALRAVEYVYTGNPNGRTNGGSSNGRTIQKTITVTTLDADLSVSPSNTTVFMIGHSNNVPVISPGSFLATFNTSAIPVIPGIVLTDGDDTTFNFADVTINAATFIAAQDRLTVTLAGSLSGTFNPVTGVLHISGTGTLAEYQQTLRSVAYNNLLGASATKTQRILSVKVNDGESDSNIGAVQISVGTSNTAPTITGAATPFYVSGEIVINNKIVVTDPDTVILGATAVFTTGFVAAEDVLLFDDQNGITGTYNGTAGLLTLSGPGNPAVYQAALRSIRYKNNSQTPNTQDRAITFTVNDGGPQIALSGTVITINKPPVVEVAKKNAASDGNVAFGIPDAITDPDNNLDLSTLQVSSEKGVATISNGIVTIDYSASKLSDPVVFDNVTITVCDTGGRCTTYILTVELRDDAFVYTGMSPNGDGVNDWFTIDFLPENTQVAIYNRWGETVFETNDYNVNEPSKRFEGKNKNGVEVIAGAYFYKIKYPGGRVKTGSIILNR